MLGNQIDMLLNTKACKNTKSYGSKSAIYEEHYEFAQEHEEHRFSRIAIFDRIVKNNTTDTMETTQGTQIWPQKHEKNIESQKHKIHE